ncbi:MAG: hypothetical protein KAY65_09400 [Planctomycetes bacterium]|nr:hypothetical protein [Planctomycetota bacterium]
MGEYDCVTVRIEKGDSLSAPSTRCHKDFELEGDQRVFSPAFGRFAASAILVLAPYSVALGEPATILLPTNSVAIHYLEPDVKRNISFAEARRMAQELQNRIDADYQSSLESDAQVPAAWEEDQ